MNVNMVTGEPGDDAPKPKTEAELQQEADDRAKVKKGQDAQAQLESPEGSRFVGIVIEKLTDRICKLISAGPDAALDPTRLAEIRGLYAGLQDLGLDIKIGKIAAARLAKEYGIE